MNKTPIMILQERMMKRGSMPQYDIIEKRSGIQILFTCKVKCEGLSADGTASNKKEAKQNAAQAMLNLLGYSSTVTLATNFTKNVNTVSTHSPADEATHSPADEATHSPSNYQQFVNYVGRLQELCMKYKLHSPVYEVVNITGPSHMSIFTISCTIQTLQASGTAGNKKDAKQHAAKNILQLLLQDQCVADLSENMQIVRKVFSNTDINPIDIFNHETLNELEVKMTDLSIEDQSSISTEIDNIIIRYKELAQINTASPESLSPQNYHTYFKERYNINDELLKILSQMCYDPTDIVEKACHLISLKFGAVKRINFSTRNQQMSAVGFKLESTPLIFEIGTGKTANDAEKQAIISIMKTILLLMN